MYHNSSLDATLRDVLAQKGENISVIRNHQDVWQISLDCFAGLPLCLSALPPPPLVLASCPFFETPSNIVRRKQRDESKDRD